MSRNSSLSISPVRRRWWVTPWSCLGHPVWSSAVVTRDDIASRLLLALRVVLVEPAGALLAQPAGGDVLAQQRARPVLVVAELAVQHLGDRQAGVEADQVGQLERAHRMVEPEADAGVDVGGRAEALVEPVAGLVEQRDQHPVDDEARDVAGADRGLAEALGERDDGVVGRLAGL